MKNYKFTINGNTYEVDILDIDGNIAKIEVNGTHYDVELHRDAPAKPKARVIKAPVAEKVSSASAAPSPAPQGNGPLTQIKAPLPGVIIQVLVRPGDAVKADQTVCTLETMKMENAIKADKSGIVTAVKIIPQQSVLQDEVLIEMN